MTGVRGPSRWVIDSLHDSPKVLGVEFKMSRGICFCSLNLADPQLCWRLAQIKADDSDGSYPCFKWDMLPHKLVQNVVQFVLQLLFHFPRWRKSAKKRGKCSTFRWSLNVRQQAYPKAWVLSSVLVNGLGELGTYLVLTAWKRNNMQLFRSCLSEAESKFLRIWLGEPAGLWTENT